jgi:hypothetical protein
VKCNEYPLHKYVLFAGKPQVVLTEKLADMTSVLLILGRNRHILSIAPQLISLEKSYKTGFTINIIYTDKAGIDDR